MRTGSLLPCGGRRDAPRLLNAVINSRICAPVCAALLAACLLNDGIGMAAAVEIIAHRGASRDAPENTLAAFQLAWDQGADGVEGDFYLTADGQIVCIHDPSTARTGDQDLPVASSTLAALKAVDVGAKKGAKFRGERMPTLAEVLALVPPGKKLFVEIKCGPEIVAPLAEALARAGLADEQVAIISFSAAVIETARKRLPRHRAYWLTDFKRDGAGWRPSFEEMIGTLRRIDATGLDFGAGSRALAPPDARRLREAGFELHCWTVDEAALARYCRQLGVRSITTNRPAEARRWLLEAKP